MPFIESVRQAEISRSNGCAVCDQPFGIDSKPEVHSVTSLHLVLVDIEGSQKYLVTDPPQGHEKLRGRLISVAIYSPTGKAKPTDGVCLCQSCHDEIHRVSLFEAIRLNKDFEGKVAPPQLLSEVTLRLLQRKQLLIYGTVDNKFAEPSQKINFSADKESSIKFTDTKINFLIDS